MRRSAITTRTHAEPSKFRLACRPCLVLVEACQTDQKKTHPGSIPKPVGLGISGSHPTIYKHLDTLALKFSGGEMEINKSSIGQTNRGESPVKPETFDMHQLCRKMQRVARSDTRYNFVRILIFFCRSPHCNDDHTTNTMHVFMASSARTRSTSCRWTCVTSANPPELYVVTHHCWTVVYTSARFGHDDRK